MSRGIDVSSYQGKIDWSKVKAAGVEHAILKVIRKDLSADKKFEENWTGCENAGMPIQGVYNYSYATNTDKSKYAADATINTLAKINSHPMIWKDVEDDCLKGLGKKLIDIILVYKEMVESAGYQFGVYTGLSFYNSYLKPYYAMIKEIPFWIARYPLSNTMTVSMDPSSTYKPLIANTMYGWQYSSKGSVPGISGNVDMNEWYVDLEAESVAIPEEKATYQLSNFILDSRSIWGVSDTAYANEIVAKTVTIATNCNRNHAIVTPLERYMNALGYYKGNIEADKGNKPSYGNGMKKAVILYQEHIVRAKEKNRDGVLTAKGATWKTLYGAN